MILEKCIVATIIDDNSSNCFIDLIRLVFSQKNVYIEWFIVFPDSETCINFALAASEIPYNQQVKIHSIVDYHNEKDYSLTEKQKKLQKFINKDKIIFIQEKENLKEENYLSNKIKEIEYMDYSSSSC